MPFETWLDGGLNSEKGISALCQVFDWVASAVTVSIHISTPYLVSLVLVLFLLTSISLSYSSVKVAWVGHFIDTHVGQISKEHEFY